MSDETPPPEGETAKPVRKAPKGAVLIGVLVGGLAVGVGAGLFAIGPMVAKSSGYVVTADSTHAEGEEGAEGEGGEHGAAAGGEHGGKEGEAAGASNLHLIDNLVLNPAGSGGTRFLMVAAAIEFKEAALVEAFKARDAEVRDIVLRVMGAKTVDQLSDMAMRDSLRKELGDSLTSLVPKAQRKQAIRRVYFPQFVIQ
jgi:flagellar FliL protein